MTQSARPRGRPPTGTNTRALIVSAAEAQFTEDGYQLTSVRAIARRAGVDPATVRHHFPDKAALFAASLSVNVSPRELLAQLAQTEPDDVGRAIAVTFLGLWDSPAGEILARVLRASVAGNEDSRRMLHEFLLAEVFGPLAARFSPDHQEERALLLVSQLMGLAIIRRIMRFEPLTSMPRAEVVAWVAPTLQRYLTGEFPSGSLVVTSR